MEVIILLAVVSLSVSVVFLFAFLWATRNGQYDDIATPAVRMLSDDTPAVRIRSDDPSASPLPINNEKQIMNLPISNQDRGFTSWS